MDGPAPDHTAPPNDGPIRSIAEPGIRVSRDVLPGLRREVSRLLNRTQTSFPGAQPVSFARKHLQELKNRDYFVCEKSDGLRYLLYLTEEGGTETVYLIDRKNDYWHIGNSSLHFPRREDVQRFHTQTLIDGELVLDVDDKEGGANPGAQGAPRIPRFLIFDCLVLDGQNLMGRSYDKRIAYVQENIVKPYNQLFEQYPDERAFQPFEVVMKQMEFSYGIPKIFNVVLPDLKHGNDGLIFTCVNSQYQHGTDEHILKWKPPEENTVDCRLRLHFATVRPGDGEDVEMVGAGGGPDGTDVDPSAPFVDYDGPPKAEIWSFHGDGRYHYFSDVLLSEDEWETLKALGDPLDDRIVECNKDESGRWRILRFRDDKSEANHISTLNSVLESIEDRVTEGDLTESATGIKNNWKVRQAQAREQAVKEKKAKEQQAAKER